ncbi:hypothetical protein F2Q70_00016640 [Brassica cretica]|uniref:Uncharacterized protein n=1 Tax=Brassica cretica TaxID=69181 RepID=A0A8S9I502_BRACR|nr:hypothetical protein F2Q70_00016640 [Brassica cretica]
MEEAMAEHIQNTQEVAHEAEKKGNDQQEVNYINKHGYVKNNQTQGAGYQQGFPQHFQGKTLVFSQAHNRFVGQNQNQNQQNPQSNQQAALAAANSPPDELKGLGMMMPTAIARSVGSGQCVQSGYHGHQHQDGQHCEKAEENETEKLFVETVLGAEERTEHPTSYEVTGPDEPTETLLVRVYFSKVPYPIPPKHLMAPISAEQLVGFRKMTQEEIKALFIEALTPALQVLPKVDDPGKFSFPRSIAGVEFKETLCDSGSQIRYASCISVVSGEQLIFFPKKQLGDKSEIKEVVDGDPHAYTKKLCGNARVNEKVQKKRVKGDPTMTLIPRKCDEKPIEDEEATEKLVVGAEWSSWGLQRGGDGEVGGCEKRLWSWGLRRGTEKEPQEEIKALFIEALIPALKVLPKVDDPGKFYFPCFIAVVEFKEALCDSGSSVNFVSKAIVDELNIVEVEFSLLGDKSEIKEVVDGDPHAYTKTLCGNARVNEKVQKKRVKGDPTMTLIPRKCDEKSIEDEKRSTLPSEKSGRSTLWNTHDFSE